MLVTDPDKTKTWRTWLYCQAHSDHLYQAVHLTLLLLNTTCPVLANNVYPDQLASKEANWSGSALFVIKYPYVNFYQVTWIK